MPLVGTAPITFAPVSQLLLMALFLESAIFQHVNFVIVRIAKKGVADCEIVEL